MNRTLALAFAAAIAAAWLLGAASAAPPSSCESAGAGAGVATDDPPFDFLFASQDDWRRIELEQALADPRPAGR